MRLPLDLGGFELVIAIVLLVAGTAILCVLTALAVRVVDRAWDAVATAAGS